MVVNEHSCRDIYPGGDGLGEMEETPSSVTA